MRIIKLKDKDGSSCGCEYTVDGRGREEHTKFCMEHETEWVIRHAAAIGSCSHANRDLVESLPGG